MTTNTLDVLRECREALQYGAVSSSQIYRLCARLDALIAEESDQVSPSEAVFAFAAWLTCRDEAVTLGATHNASPAAELVGAFNKSQGFAGPRDDYTNRLKPYPKESVATHSGNNDCNSEAVLATAPSRDVLSEPASATDTQQNASPAGYSGNPYWMIERGSPCEWWVGNHRRSNAFGGEWTTDSSKAMHFPSEEQAKRHIEDLVLWEIRGPLRATEHIDCIGPDHASAEGMPAMPKPFAMYVGERLMDNGTKEMFGERYGDDEGLKQILFTEEQMREYAQTHALDLARRLAESERDARRYRWKRHREWLRHNFPVGFDEQQWKAAYDFTHDQGITGEEWPDDNAAISARGAK